MTSQAGWSTRPWSREDIGIVRPWWRRMQAAGMGDWGDGPADDELAPLGCLSLLGEDPVACVFIYMAPSGEYAAIYSAFCDISLPGHACFRGISLAARGAIDMCRDAGMRQVVNYTRTPAVVKAFELAGFRHDGSEYTHVYLSDEVIPWLEP